ncbi:MAG: phosphoglucosamine mutase [Acidobacteria bacterium]|nr:MAG: phosphoglucosamine mutase [Acidobacteriota bacterium]
MKFGTDGVRGVAGQPPLDPVTISRLGAALVRRTEYAHASARDHAQPVHIAVGRDTRESGPWIEEALARGVTAAGGRLTTFGVIPTPGVAYLTRTGPFDLGVVISASHNPFADNGLKVFSGRGEKFGEPEERAVEAIVADPSWTVDDVRPVVERSNLVAEYLAHTKLLLPSTGNLQGARIAIDMGHGATTTTAPTLLKSLGFELVEIGNAPNGKNINLECGSTHPEALAAAVVAHKCRLGIAFDGDGDRAIFVDHTGRVVNGDAVLLICGTRLKALNQLPGDTVVATVMSNLGLELAFKARGIRMLRTPVGDKYVMEEMLKNGYAIGGEQSGHVICAEHLFTGDGLATGLLVMRAMVESGRELADLAGELTMYPQVLVNVRTKSRTDVNEVPAVARVIHQVTRAMEGNGRLLIRYSGTEPLLRIMIEGQDDATIKGWAEEIAAAVRAELA